MILYHFTNSRFIPGIKKYGLTRGRTPYLENGVKVLNNHQWITIDGNVKNQNWAKGITIPYDRNEYRITVNIPKNKEGNLYDMDTLIKEILDHQIVAGFNDYSQETKNWRVYIGRIPRQWIKNIRRIN